MLGWTSPWLLPCEGTSVQKAGAGLSRAGAVSALFSFSLQLKLSWCGGYNWGLSGSCSTPVCVCNSSLQPGSVLLCAGNHMGAELGAVTQSPAL